MSLLKDLDINFSKNQTTRSLDALEKSGFRTNQYRYPIDVGSTDKGHYVVFYVNEQIRTSFPGQTVSKEVSAIERNSLGSGNEIYGARGTLRNIASTAKNLNTKFSSDVSQFVTNAIDDIQKILPKGVNEALRTARNSDAAKIIKDGAEAAKNAVKDEFQNITGENAARNLRRISDAIILYMPDTMAISYNQQYSDVSMSGAAGLVGVGASVLKNLNNASAQEAGRILGQNLSPFAANKVKNAFGQQGEVLFSTAMGGAVINPQLELLYVSPAFREFQFEFMFYPRSVDEAKQVYFIIEKLRYHQAPEIKPGNAGYFLIPPSEFDIEFHYNGERNVNLPVLSTCVLQSINLDYAPNGFSAYEVDGKDSSTTQVGGTGSPVAIRMTLNFKETEILTKGSYKNFDESTRSNIPVSAAPLTPGQYGRFV